MFSKICFWKNVLIALFSCFLILTPRISAQETGVTEPAIPVYIVCPYHIDSLKKAYETSLANGSGYVTEKKYDTLMIQLQKSSAETTAHFTWLFMVIALLGVMNITLLFSFARMRKELQELRTLELHHKFLSLPTPAMEPPAAVVMPEVNLDVPAPSPEVKPSPKPRRAPARKKKATT